MFGNNSSGRARQLFADQFQPDGADFLYRRNLRGPAYRVSAAERDAFVADYNRNLRRMTWAITVGTIVAIVGTVAISMWLDIDPGRGGPYLGAGLIALLICCAIITTRRFYSIPARALEHRTPISPALSNEERRRLNFSRLTWGQLGTGAVMAVILPFHAAHALAGWKRLWFVISGVLLLLIAVQAVRKWRYQQAS